MPKNRTISIYIDDIILVMAGPGNFQSLSSIADSTPDNLSLQGKLAKGSSYWKFELSRVKLCGNSLNGKRKFVRLSARFELARVRGIRSRLILLLLLVMYRSR